MIQRGWSDLHKRWSRSRAPLRPHAQVIAAFETLLAAHPGRRLLLGVTPELATLSAPVTAIDWSAAMIAQVWPGNAPGHRAVQGDWADMPFAPGSFVAAVADGAVNMLRWPDDYCALAARLAEAVRPGGRIVMRCFTAPDTPEALADLAGQVLAGTPIGFHAFKWRLAMAVADGVDVAMRRVWEVFQSCFPDREALCRATGWTSEIVAEIDDYAVSPLHKSFPTRAQLLACFPGAYLVESGDYELAERCPMLVIDL